MIKKYKKNNDPKVVSNTQHTISTPTASTNIVDKPIKPNYVSGIEDYVRKGQILHAVKIMRDTNEMSIMQCKEIIDTYRETGNWDHFKYAFHPKDLAQKIVNKLQDKNLLSDDCSISGLIYLIDKTIRYNE